MTKKDKETNSQKDKMAKGQNYKRQKDKITKIYIGVLV